MSGDVSLPALSQDINIKTSQLDDAIAKADKFSQSMKNALNVDTRGFTDSMNKVKVSLDDTAASTKTLQDSINKVTDALAKSAAASDKAKNNYQNLGQAADGATPKVRQLSDALDKEAVSAAASAAATDKSKNSIQNLGNAASTTATKLAAFSLSLAKLSTMATAGAVVGDLAASTVGLGTSIVQTLPLLASMPGLFAPIVLGAAGIVAAISGNKGLTPALNSFVKQLEPLQKELQKGLTQPIKDTLTDVEGLFPTLKAGVTQFIPEVKTVIGSLDDVITSSSFKDDFNTLITGAITNFGRLGDAGVHAFNAATTVVATAQPLVNTFAQGIDNAAQRIDGLVAGAKASGELEQIFATASQRGQQFGDILTNLVSGVINLGKAASDSGLANSITSALQKGTQSFADFTSSNQALLVRFFDNAGNTAQQFGTLASDALKGVVTILAEVNVSPVVHDLDTLIQPLQSALPGAINATVKSLGQIAPTVQDAIPFLGVMAQSTVKVLGDIGPLADDVVKRVGPPLAEAFKEAGDAADQLEPRIQKDFDGVANAVQHALGGLASGAAGAGAGGLFSALGVAAEGGVKVVNDALTQLGDAAKVVGTDLKPVTDSISNFLASLSKSGGVFGAAEAGVTVFFDAVKTGTTILKPLIDLISGIVNTVSGLPGPLEDAVIAFTAFRIAPSIFSLFKSSASDASNATKELGDNASGAASKGNALTNFFNNITSPIKNTVQQVKQFSDEMKVTGSLSDSFGKNLTTAERAIATLQTTTTSAGSSLRNFSNTFSDIKAGAAGAGEPVNNLTAAFKTLAETSQPIGNIRNAFNDAAQSADGFSLKAGLAAAAGQTVKSAAGGLVSALGGGFGIALTGASILLGFLADAQQKAAQAAAQHQQNVQTLTSALQQSAGAIDKNVQQTEAQALQQQKLADGTTNIADGFGKFGISLTQATTAITQGGAPLDNLRSKLQGIIDANTQSIPVTNRAGVVAGEYIKVQNDEAKSAKSVLDALNDQTGAFAEAIKNHQQLANVTGISAQSTNNLADDMAVLADNTKSASDKASALADSLDQLSGGAISLQDAQNKLNQTFSQLSQYASTASHDTDDWGKALINATGGVNTLHANGQQLQQGLSDIVKNMSSVATQTAQVDANSGKLQNTYKDVTGVVADARQRFIDLAGQFGITADEAGKLADQYGIIPDKVATNVSAPGIGDTLKQVGSVIQALNSIPPDTPITVSLDNQAAVTALQQMGYQVQHLTGNQYAVVLGANTASGQKALTDYVGQINASKGTVSITGNNKPAQITLVDLLNQVNNAVGIANIKGDSKEASQILSDFLNVVNTSNGQSTITANNSPALQALYDLLARISGSSAGTTTTNDTSPAQGAIDEFYKRNNGLTITSYLNIVQSGGGGSTYTPFSLPGHEHGDIVRFASGGKYSPMPAGLAQRVKPNTWRIVGDRAWGDEAYIPINNSVRSHALLNETAKEMGYALEKFASGGISQISRAQSANQAMQVASLPALPQVISIPISGVGGGNQPIVVHVYIGDQEITGLISSVVAHQTNVASAAQGRALTSGAVG